MSPPAVADGTDTLIPLEDRTGWEAALAGHPHAFAHTWDNCRAMAGTTGHATYLYSFRSDGVRVLCPLAERPAADHVDVVTPYGFSGFVGSGDCSGFDSHWRAFAEGRGYVCAYLLLNPVIPNPTLFAADAERHKTLFVFDLTLDEDELFARLSTNRRRQVRRAEPEALVTDREQLTEFFVETYPAFIAARDAAGVYDLSEQSMRELCASESVFLIGARSGGRICAVSLFGFTRHAGDYLYNASLPGHEEWSAILIWAAVRDLKARGVPTLNLGGAVSEDDGVAEFKRRFGTGEVPLHNVKQVYRPDVYRELCDRAGVDAEAAGYFPAYRA
jgi:hypothetical protein